MLLADHSGTGGESETESLRGEEEGQDTGNDNSQQVSTVKGDGDAEKMGVDKSKLTQVEK